MEPNPNGQYLFAELLVPEMSISRDIAALLAGVFDFRDSNRLKKKERKLQCP